MKPDPDMMRMAQRKAAETLEAVARFQVRTGFNSGSDATHAQAYRSIRDLADELQSLSTKLNHICLDTDERLTPASRINE